MRLFYVCAGLVFEPVFNLINLLNMKYSPLIFLLVLFTSFSFQASAQNKEEERLEKAVQVIKDFGNLEESIPHELLQISRGIIIVPKMINAGFVLAGKRGRGVAMVKNEDGSWSDPVFVTITGGGVGFQAGIQSVDLVLIFKHKETLEDIGEGTFTLGGDISATAGPIGRNSTATTDYKFEAEVYSYSKSKGLFAGISLTGSAITVDNTANEKYYGEQLSVSEIFSDGNTDDRYIRSLRKELQSLTGK